MQEIIYNGDLSKLSAISLKDKDTGEVLKFVRVNKKDLLESLKSDQRYIALRGFELATIMDDIAKGIKSKGCFNPIISLEDLERLDYEMRNYIETLDYIIKRCEDGELREQKDV